MANTSARSSYTNNWPKMPVTDFPSIDWAMYYFGQHVEHDIVSAYAWSYLAAESGIAPYRKFNRQMDKA